MFQVGAWFPEGLRNRGDAAILQVQNEGVESVKASFGFGKLFSWMSGVPSWCFLSASEHRRLEPESQSVQCVVTKHHIGVDGNSFEGGNLVLCRCGVQCSKLGQRRDVKLPC